MKYYVGLGSRLRPPRSVPSTRTERSSERALRHPIQMRSQIGWSSLALPSNEWDSRPVPPPHGSTADSGTGACPRFASILVRSGLQVMSTVRPLGASPVVLALVSLGALSCRPRARS